MQDKLGSFNKLTNENDYEATLMRFSKFTADHKIFMEQEAERLKYGILKAQHEEEVAKNVSEVESNDFANGAGYCSLDYTGVGLVTLAAVTLSYVIGRGAHMLNYASSDDIDLHFQHYAEVWHNLLCPHQEACS